VTNGYQRKQSLNIDNDGEQEEFSVCIGVSKGNGELRLYMSPDELEFLVIQGNQILKENDRIKIERELQ